MEVAAYFEEEAIEQMQLSLSQTVGLPNRERTAKAVNAVFARVTEWNILPFLQENMPLLLAAISQEEAQKHLRSMEERILELLMQADIEFTQPLETVAAAIHILYLSIQYIDGQDSFPNALKLLVLGTCDQMVKA